MALKLVFLGRLEDVAGGAERAIPLVSTIDAAIAALEPALAQALTGPRVKLAINGVLLRGRETPPLADGDEIAFLPPVSGG
jgi:molybdopterin synthase sulfur carrier subunit